ncbi:ImmA/IrrE family metallo-endopeptidase [Geomicrobium sp. JCM 19055]|uniref:ImmA/IrrE family metallo-endopeptidase n=1 Tax=Geomicrobium sp. JCM 19055 TaxID=1460649 RepID=UPI0005A80132|nr:ImmA/IrrE family metallo-endopeptidase [Geomicrobium sp. JCM 19055]
MKSISCLNPTLIAEKLGIYLRVTEGRTRSEETLGIKIIFLNKNLSPYEKVWAFFHELGHFYLHDLDQRKAVKSVADFMEIQANRFAYYASMPINLVIDEYKRDSLITVDELAHRFQVPLAHAEVRAQQIQSKYILSRGAA